MQKQFQDLRRTIYKTEVELKQFRQILVNAVLATDIMDPDLKALRNDRWSKAFAAGAHQDDNIHGRSLKATIVIEHLMQASDISHTMQHWSIYLKWNRRLFEEMHKAYKEGRAEKDPSTFWYKGEIGFFDFYIIPLAKKLRDCGVFGVSSDECLQYAMSNRDEWVQKGQGMVIEYTDSISRRELEEQKSIEPPLRAKAHASSSGRSRKGFNEAPESWIEDGSKKFDETPDFLIDDAETASDETGEAVLEKAGKGFDAVVEC